MNARLVALVSVTLVLATTAVRSADPVPGTLWQTTTQMAMPAIMPGKNTAMPPRVQQLCAAKNSAQPPITVEKNCQISAVARAGDTVRWKMRCMGQKPMDGEGELTFQGNDAYSGHITMNMDEATTMNITGKRLGDCDASEAR